MPGDEEKQEEAACKADAPHDQPRKQHSADKCLPNDLNTHRSVNIDGCDEELAINHLNPYTARVLQEL